MKTFLQHSKDYEKSEIERQLAHFRDMAEKSKLSAETSLMRGDLDGHVTFMAKHAHFMKQYDHLNSIKEGVERIEEGESIVTPRKTLHGEPPKGTYAYERKYGAYTAKGELRKKPNPNKPPVKEDVELDEDWQKVNKADRTDGLSQKAVDAYRRENPGSKLQTAVTEKNPKGKRAARRKSFCSRMSGMKKRLTNPENARDPDSPINKALRRWNC